MPPALTDFIGQTVGGTLSVGGIGGMAHRHGAQIDNVRELHVITGEGRLLHCSEHRHRDVFDAALAGQGQVGIIVRATLKLIAAPRRIRVFNLVYFNLAVMTVEMQRLMDDQRFEYLEGFSFQQANGAWIYVLQAGSYHRPPAAPDDMALLAGLNDVRNFIAIDDQDFSTFANRVQVPFTGAHPWIDLILPERGIESFVTQVEQTLKPLIAGDRFSILLIPMRTDRFTRPLFRAPATIRRTCSPVGPTWFDAGSVGLRRFTHRLCTAEVHVLGLDRPGLASWGRLTGPVQVCVGDNLVRRRCAPAGLVVGRVGVTDQGGVVTPDERAMKG
jgi:cytokinin dehydrogenase